MNHSAIQLRLVRNRIQSDGASAPAAGTGIVVWTVLIPLSTPRRWTPGISDDARRSACPAPSVIRKRSGAANRAGSSGPEDALGGTLRRSHRGFHVLASGAVVREHVDQHEVGDRGRGILAQLATAGRGRRR